MFEIISQDCFQSRFEFCTFTQPDDFIKILYYSKIAQQRIEIIARDLGCISHFKSER